MMTRTLLIVGLLVAACGAASSGDDPATQPAGDDNVVRLVSTDGGTAPAAMSPVVAAAAQRVTLELAKSDMVDALRLVASQGGLNLVVGPEVSGEVSVSLKDVPVDQALEAIAAGNGLVISNQNGIVTVSKAAAAASQPANAPPVMHTRVFRPRSVSATDLRWALEPALSPYRDLSGQRLARITVLNEDSRPAYGMSTLSNGGFGSGSGSTQSPQPQTTLGVAGAVAGSIAGIPNAAGGGGVLDDPTRMVQQSQVLVVTDTPERLEEIALLIEELDRAPRQVLIEARIVEMTLTLQKQLGIDWNVEVSANGPRLEHQFPLYRRAGFQQDSSGSIQASLGTVDFSRFSAVLEANQTDGGIRILANPRLLVFNNHRASILVGERYPILRSSLTDFGTATESFEQYIPVGVQLEVSPTILADGRVSLLIHPATTALGEDVVGTTGLRVARINTRELDTRAVVRDSQTIVLGGLISDRRSNEQRKVTGLGDIPIIDWLFRQERRRDERVDLLIFLTVYVEGADKPDERDQEVYDRYRPHFKRSTSLKEVPLQFELPGFDQDGEKGNGLKYMDEVRTPASQPGDEVGTK